MLVTILISFYFIGSAFFADYDINTATLPTEVPFYSQSINLCDTKKDYQTADISFQNLDSLRKEIERADCTKPELIMAFVDTVISRKATEHYAFAQELYFQFLQEAKTDINFDLIATEANKLVPLVPDEEKKIWLEKIRNQDHSLAGEMFYFWNLRDPVLSTPINERLSEHWNRIAYSRENFIKNDHGVYGTDDRGTVYVKYGPSTFKRSGLLSPSNAEIRSKLYDLASFKGGIDSRELFNLNMSIKQQYIPKYYEVWVYRNLGLKQPLLFIFGESANRGTFGLRKSLEDFIPNGSFNMGISSSWRYDTGPRGLTAGPFLQMALYDRLSTIDIYFGKQLTTYEDNWMKYMRGQLNFSSFKMINNSPKAEMELKKIQDRAPETKSSLDERLNLISQSYKVYRFLDDKNEAYRKVILFSSPTKNLIAYDAVINQHRKPVYTLTALAAIVSSNGQKTLFDKQKIHLRSDHHDGSSFLINIPEAYLTRRTEPSKVLVSSEIARIPQSKEDDTAADKYILASVVDSVKKVKPLSEDSQFLEVSDIIWGYKDERRFEDVNAFTFTVPEDEILPAG
ncbi:MAG: GWxTD domain-containing protein, partial [Candidatus Halalkalibacterium sp. M3_1C_030]